jgi:hypothetical protein
MSSNKTKGQPSRLNSHQPGSKDIFEGEFVKFLSFLQFNSSNSLWKGEYQRCRIFHWIRY